MFMIAMYAWIYSKFLLGRKLNKVNFFFGS